MFSPATTETLALVVVGLIAASPFILAAVGLRRSSHPKFLSALIFVSKVWPRLLWRARVNRPFPIPPHKGALVVCNHTSSIDPWIIYIAANRVMAYMIATEYYHNPWLRWFFDPVPCVPVNRGGIDTSATKQAIRFAQAGKLLGVFPEGRINHTHELLLPGRPGPAMIAIKGRVPIVPCYIHDAPRSESVFCTFFIPANVRIVIGDPIDITPYVAREKEEGILQELTLRMLKEIATLAGRSDFVPQLAGRKWKPGADEAVDANGVSVTP